MPPNPFSPPSANVESFGDDFEHSLAVTYHLKRRDQLLWNIVHQFRSPVFQVFIVALSMFIALADGWEKSFTFTFLAIYLVLWLVQIATTALTISFGRNRRLLTTHTIRLATDSIIVETEYSKAYYYWHAWTGSSTAPDSLRCISMPLRRTSFRAEPSRALKSGSSSSPLFDPDDVMPETCHERAPKLVSSCALTVIPNLTSAGFDRHERQTFIAKPAT